MTFLHIPSSQTLLARILADPFLPERVQSLGTTEIDERSFRLGEAAKRVLETCEKGLSRRSSCKSFIEAFRAGWKQRERA